MDIQQFVYVCIVTQVLYLLSFLSILIFANLYLYSKNLCF